MNATLSGSGGKTRLAATETLRPPGTLPAIRRAVLVAVHGELQMNGRKGGGIYTALKTLGGESVAIGVADVVKVDVFMICEVGEVNEILSSMGNRCFY